MQDINEKPNEENVKDRDKDANPGVANKFFIKKKTAKLITLNKPEKTQKIKLAASIHFILLSL